MISALNLKLSKVIVVVVAILNMLIVIAIIEYNYNISHIDYRQVKIPTTTKFFHDDGMMDSNDTLNELGYQLEPHNVKFKYLNMKNKQGTKESILLGNEQTYDNLLQQRIHEPKDLDLSTIRPPAAENIDSYDRANAVIIALVRNTEMMKISKSIKKFETTFNSKFRYPYMFINDEPFSDRFKQRMNKLILGPKEFVVIPRELWDKPDFIDTTLETKNMNVLHSKNIAYAKKESYHNMCRFYLGTFYQVPELQKYKYYWRIEPDVQFYNDVNYDVFKYLEKTGKIYGFTINLYDIQETVETLWPETLKFLNQGDNYKYVNPNGAFQWLLENKQNPDKSDITGGYSTCHFWSNFEIGDMDFFRSDAYNEWFKYLDSTGKFYYERWGDAPVHSMGLALFAPKDKIHWFRDIGYFHDPYVNCPNSPTTTGCKIGQFSRWKHLADQNCMANWIDYSMEDPSSIY